jgi:cation:H+ antiporter
MIRFLVLAGSGLLVQAGVDVATHAHPAHLLWTSPAIIGAAMLIAWGAEAAQFMVSQGLALAILAWLQTLPEFAVEANIAWKAGRHVPNFTTDLVTANFTGSIRLLMGLGMPLVYFIYAFTQKGPRRRSIDLEPLHSVEIVSLFPPVMYFFFIAWRGRLDLMDSIILLGFYAIYMGLLLKMPAEQEGETMEELPAVSRFILKQGRLGRILGITGIFVAGGAVLIVSVDPFIEGLQSLAFKLGISSYFFIQWIAPFMSEFPESASALNWARQEKKACMSLMNFLSSNLSQMTLLVAMIPIVYCVAAGSVSPIWFSPSQKAEVLLTASQAGLCMVLLFNMKFEWWEGVGMFALFMIQFLSPAWTKLVPGLKSDDVRQAMVYVYCGWALLEVALAVFGLRRWSFPLRLGKDSRRFLHAR